MPDYSLITVYYNDRSDLSETTRHEISRLPVRDTLERVKRNCARLGVSARIVDETGKLVDLVDAPRN